MQVVYLGVIQDMSAGEGVSVTKKERKPMQGELMSGIRCRQPGLSLSEGLRQMVWEAPEACPTLKARKWGICSLSLFIHLPVDGHLVVSSFGLL